jgi:hypothetical protein
LADVIMWKRDIDGSSGGLFSVVTCDRAEDFQVEYGDKLGAEEYEAIGFEEGCLSLKKGNARLLLCKPSPPFAFDHPGSRGQVGFVKGCAATR